MGKTDKANRKVVITIMVCTILDSTKSELMYVVQGSNPICSILEIRNGEDLWQWSQLAENNIFVGQSFILPKKIHQRKAFVCCSCTQA